MQNLAANANTGTSGEFFVLSMLLRKNREAYMTLGNTKTVDIVVFAGGVKKTVDVKCSEYDKDFILGTVRSSRKSAFEQSLQDPCHFYVFVTYLNKMANERVVPDCFIVPASQVLQVSRFTSGLGKTQKNPNDPTLALNASMKKLRASTFLHAWHLI